MTYKITEMYSIDELNSKDSSEQEQIRTRKIFDHIKERSIDKQPISEHEKDFFCFGVEFSSLNDGKIKDYPCCDNYKFKMIYLSYFRDLSGNGEYEKGKGGTIYKVKRFECDKDIAYLSQVAKEWLDIINVTNHSNELLKQISKETREKLKKVEKNKGMLILRRDKERYTLNKRRILLQLKYIYCTALLIFEMFGDKDFIFSINGQDIEINEYSIVHILNRHFSEITQRQSDRSYHGKDIKPKYLNKHLKDIITVIDSSGLLKDKDIKIINFRYKGINYAIWVNKRIKQVKNIGNVEYNRLETFYPIENPDDLKRLEVESEYHQINEDIGIYIQIPNPPLAEQKSKAEKLSTVDAAIGLTSCHLCLPRTQKRSLIQ